MLTLSGALGGSAQTQELSLPQFVVPEGDQATSPEVIIAPRPGAALTLADVERMALANNPTVGRAAAQVRAIEGKWLQAGLYPNPIIGYAAEEVGNEGSAGLHRLFIQKRWVRGGKLSLSQAAANEEIAKAQQELAAQQRRVLTDATLCFYDVLIAEATVATATELVTLGQRTLDATDNLLMAREVGRVDLLQSRIALGNAKVRLARANAQRERAWRRLGSVVGLPALAPQAVAGDPQADLPRLTWDASLAQLESSSPELAAAYAEVGRSQWQLDREVAETVPDVTVQMSAGVDDASGDAFSGVQVSMPWMRCNRNQGNIARANAEFVIASQEVERVKLNLRNRLAVAFQTYDAARAEYEILVEQIKDAKASLDLVRAGYPEEFSYLNLSAAQLSYFQAELDRLDALARLRAAVVLIEGLLLSDSLAN